MSRRPNKTRAPRMAYDAVRDRRRATALAQRGESPTERAARLVALRK
ncbi:hypothetical protein [Microbacterium sp. ZOR0019]|nr:hypothetical protein [Microbacterium sp. ZOR0019]